MRTLLILAAMWTSAASVFAYNTSPLGLQPKGAVSRPRLWGDKLPGEGTGLWATKMTNARD